jgi:hypothetical protein
MWELLFCLSVVLACTSWVSVPHRMLDRWTKLYILFCELKTWQRNVGVMALDLVVRKYVCWHTQNIAHPSLLSDQSLLVTMLSSILWSTVFLIAELVIV